MAAVLLLSACSSKDQPAPLPEGPPPADEPPETARCERQDFADEVDIAEGSGAVFVDDVGLVVAADSGWNGAYVVLDPDSGEERERGRLPIPDSISDDVEGLAMAEGRLHAITSSGHMIELVRVEKGFRPARAPYPITEQRGCGPKATNCGFNFEGLCLGAIRRGPLAGCAGAVASKSRGELMCLSRAEGRLTLVANKRQEVARDRTLSGCSIADGTVWAATNLLAGNAIIEIDGRAMRRHASWAAGSIEAIAARGRDLVLVSDTQVAPSALFRYRCADRE